MSEQQKHHLSKKKFIRIVFLLLLILIPRKTYGQLRGLIEFSYDIYDLGTACQKSRFNTLEMLQIEDFFSPLSLKGCKKSRVNSFRQDYKANYSSKLITQKIGNFTLGAGYIKIENDSDLLEAKTINDNYIFNGALNLFPRRNIPLILHYNRSISELDTTTRLPGTLALQEQEKQTPITFLTRTNNYGGMWRILNRKKLPTIVLSYNQGDTKTDDVFYKRLEKRKSARAELVKGGMKTRYRASYNYEDFVDLTRENKFKSEVYGLNFENQITRRAIMRFFSNYNKRHNGKTLTAGTNLFMRHSLRFDSNYEYTFNRGEDDFSEAITYIHSLRTNFRYSPDDKTDTRSSYGYSASSGEFFSDIHSLSTAATYKMRKNLIPNASIALIRSNAESLSSLFQNYQIGISHSHQFKLTLLNSSYSTNFGLQSLTPGLSSNTITNNISSNLSSRAWRYAQLFTSYRFSHIISDIRKQSSRTYENTFGAGANSSYLRNTILRTSLTYSIIIREGEGVSQPGTNHNYYSDSGVDYYLFRDMILSAGFVYNFFQSPGGDLAINKVYYHQATINRRLTRALNFNFTLRQQINLFRRNKTIDTQLRTHFDYTLGKLVFQADYYFGSNDASLSSIKEQRITGKISRRF